MKKSLKKICSILALAVCSACLTVSPVQASATTFKQGDVNGDGAVNVSDSQAITKFLLGQVGADGATSERLDVDQNGIIDVNDKTLLRNIITHSVTGKTITSTSTAFPTQDKSRVYYKYDVDGSFIGSYTLNSVNNISTVSERTIIGDDDRVPENGLLGVVRIKGIGTAFIVDDHTLLTAAHCLYNPITDKLNTNITVSMYDEYNHEDTSVSITPLVYDIPYNFISSHDMDFDYATITVKEDLSKYINFNVGVARNNLIEKNDSLYITGFGGNGTNVNNDLINVKSTGVGKLTSIFSSNKKMTYTTDAIGGDSGSPVYVITNGTRTVIGIHTNGDFENNNNNHGTCITTDVLHFIYNNNYLG